MEEKQINRYLRREFRVVGWLLIAYYFIMNAMVFVAAFSDVARQMLAAMLRGEFFAEPDLQAILGNGWGYITAVAIGMLFLYCWKDAGFWKESVLASHGRMGILDFTLLVCLCMTAQLVNSVWVTGLEWVMNLFDKSLTGILDTVSGKSDTFSMFLYASILAPISEELIFRGVVLQSLRPYGKRFAVVCSAVLFGVFHGNLIQTPYAFLLGIVLGYVTVEYSIGWAVALHAFNNLILADILTRVMELLPAPIADTVILLLLGAAAIAAVVGLFLRRRQIAASFRADWMDRRCLKCFFTNSGVLALLALMAVNAFVLFL